MADPGSLQHQAPVQKKEETEQEGGVKMAPPQFKLAAGADAGAGDGVTQRKEGDAGTAGAAAGGDGGVPQEVIDHLKLREGWRTVVYLDSLGLPTVGLGHLLTAADKKSYKVGDSVPLTTLEAWAQADAKKAYDAGKSQCATLGVTDQAFINAMASVNFQLGTKWNTIHKKTWGYLVAHEWEKAALEAGDSSWAKQTPVRVADFQAACRALAAGGSSTAPKPATTTTTTTAPATSGEAAGPAKYDFKIGQPTGKGSVTAASLNVRTGPGTNYDKTGHALAKGTSVTIYGTANGWSCIGDGQWVSNQYISTEQAAATNGATKVTAPEPAKQAGPDLKPVAQAVYDAMFSGISIGTDEDKVYTNLAKLNHDKGMIELFKDTYRAMFQRDVVADIQAEFSDSWMFGDQLSKALGYLKVAAPVVKPAAAAATTPVAKPAKDGTTATAPVKDNTTTTTSNTTPVAAPPTTKLDAFSLSGSVGKTLAGKKGPIAADNFAKDVKIVQSFLVTAGYLQATDSEVTGAAIIAKNTPTNKIPEASLTNTIAAIKEWQLKGATVKGGTADGQISKKGASATAANILTEVYNKYGGEPPLEKEVMVLNTSQWHSQGRFGFNYRGGDEDKETKYIAYVKELTGIDDPALLFNAPKDKIDKVKTNSEFATTTFYEHDDVKNHGIREADKISHPKPNWICCFDTAKKMLGYTGATPHGADEKIQTFVESSHTGGKFTPQASIGFHYIDSQLRNGKAVFVGVDKISGDDKNYNEGVTDHFICIVGKGKDENGWYFRYFDPASTHKNTGTSASNKLRIGANFQSLSGGNYNVSQVRVNEEEGI